MTDAGAGTARSFSDKWSHDPSLAFEQTLDERSEISRWILTRNGFGSHARGPTGLRTAERSPARSAG